MDAEPVSVGSLVAIGIWVILVTVVAWDDRRRERKHQDVDALAERKARELAGRDA